MRLYRDQVGNLNEAGEEVRFFIKIVFRFAKYRDMVQLVLNIR